MGVWITGECGFHFPFLLVPKFGTKYGVLLQEGSKMKADYEVAWDKDGFFLNSRNQTQENSSRARETTTYPRQQQHFSRFSAHEAPRKRFKVRNSIANYTI